MQCPVEMVCPPSSHLIEQTCDALTLEQRVRLVTTTGGLDGRTVGDVVVIGVTVQEGIDSVASEAS